MSAPQGQRSASPAGKTLLSGVMTFMHDESRQPHPLLPRVRAIVVVIASSVHGETSRTLSRHDHEHDATQTPCSAMCKLCDATPRLARLNAGGGDARLAAGEGASAPWWRSPQTPRPPPRLRTSACWPPCRAPASCQGKSPCRSTWCLAIPAIPIPESCCDMEGSGRNNGMLAW